MVKAIFFQFAEVWLQFKQNKTVSVCNGHKNVAVSFMRLNSDELDWIHELDLHGPITLLCITFHNMFCYIQFSNGLQHLDNFL